MKPMLLQDPSVFFTFFLWWDFEFAPENGSVAIFGYYVITSQDYTKVEHVKTWVLSSSLAKFPIVLIVTIMWCASRFHILLVRENFFHFRLFCSLCWLSTWKMRRSRYCKYKDGEIGHRSISGKPALKIWRYFTGIQAGKTPLFF